MGREWAFGRRRARVRRRERRRRLRQKASNLLLHKYNFLSFEPLAVYIAMQYIGSGIGFSCHSNPILARGDTWPCFEQIGRHLDSAIGPRGAWPPRSLSLGLQGGGSFGAFTWGVLDRLLEDDRVRFDTLSGASAGAINAVLLAMGLAEGGREGARDKLARFWKRLSQAAAFVPFANNAGLTPSAASRTLSFWTRFVSPYQYNPFDLNPLRILLTRKSISSGCARSGRSASSSRRRASPTAGRGFSAMTRSPSIR